MGLEASEGREGGRIPLPETTWQKIPEFSCEQLAEIHATSLIAVKASQYVNICLEKIMVKLLSVQATDVQSYTSYLLFIYLVYLSENKNQIISICVV